MTEIIPYTMVPRNVGTMSIPVYATVHTRSAHVHVHALLPWFLQGTSGVIDLIASFLGPKHVWISVTCDLEMLYHHRNRDLYFIYDILSKRLPMSDSLIETASNCMRQGVEVEVHNQHCTPPTGCIYTNVYTKPLLLGQGLYYTRNGHLGKKQELQHLVRLITCHGNATSTCPPMPTVGRHAVVTPRSRIHTWGHVPPCIQVIAIEDLSEIDTTLEWDSILLDEIEAAVPSTVSVFPDSRHLSGQICREMYLIDRAFPRRYRTVYCTKALSESKILDCMFILQTTYEGVKFIPETFTQLRTRVIQVAETMFLNDLIHVSTHHHPN
jgi:hypothetical protein